jgi:hypothetical protein
MQKGERFQDWEWLPDQVSGVNEFMISLCETGAQTMYDEIAAELRKEHTLVLSPSKKKDGNWVIHLLTLGPEGFEFDIEEGLTDAIAYALDDDMGWDLSGLRAALADGVAAIDAEMARREAQDAAD